MLVLIKDVMALFSLAGFSAASLMWMDVLTRMGGF
ncbi:hypothetical protein MXMO3_02056 [Maritalea myrionectae]|uniref:Uncharacterized protein n=1 Tax=Maritalea myrionectae TaxID=454601 RepID=A0A2R4MEW4_9HYPH|nr:hypothetical protein MXMO3_02056 [Maritalea myrionectae]